MGSAMLSPSTAPLLAVEGLQAWYGESHVLHGASFEVLVGEVVTLLGRNGAGKTTTLKSIMGIVGQRSGSVRYEGRELIGLTSDRIARLGIALCPEERGIFASLNVEENLLLPPKVRPGGLELGRIFELFPNLQERISSQGTKLSGGEQQMLAIGRILRTGARVGGIGVREGRLGHRRSKFKAFSRRNASCSAAYSRTAQRRRNRQRIQAS